MVTIKNKVLSDTLGCISGVNSNGRYRKYNDGTLICTKTATVRHTQHTAWASLYSSELINLGAMPINFIEPPQVSVLLTSSTSAWVNYYNSQDLKKSNWGSVYLISPVFVPSTESTIDCIAVGRWM